VKLINKLHQSIWIIAGFNITVLICIAIIQKLLLLDVIDSTNILYTLQLYSVEITLPGFVFVFWSLCIHYNKLYSSLDGKYAKLHENNIYLMYASKMIRHDLHSGINTYIPRGIKAIRRKLTTKLINELNLGTSLRLIESGLRQTQLVYAGIREFTNIVKTGSILNRTHVNLHEDFQEYLHETVHNSFVQISKMDTAYMNSELMCSVLDNLVRNGLKYNTQETKLIKIYMKGTSIVVEDNGYGMSEQQFNEYIQPYSRGNSAVSGSGLGLSICKMICDIHGYTMSCEQLEVGTRIIINGVFND
jgi:signal transduction histidine kinase